MSPGEQLREWARSLEAQRGNPATSMVTRQRIVELAQSLRVDAFREDPQFLLLCGATTWHWRVLARMAAAHRAAGGGDVAVDIPTTVNANAVLTLQGLGLLEEVGRTASAVGKWRPTERGIQALLAFAHPKDLPA